MRRKLVLSLFAAVPIGLFAFSTGPPIKRTGAAVDGGLDCSVCHRTFAPANSDPRGSVSIDASGYSPGVKQTIKVTIKHPEAMRWGFQLTARLASDQTKEAGTFSVNDLVRVRCDPTGDAPCNGALEFAEHNNAQFTDPGAGFTYQVDWTPPATDVGPIIFYAAGNAANGDRNLTGDRVYTTSKMIEAPCSVTGKPSIRAIVNAASFATGGVGPNSIITIFGSNFATSKRSADRPDFVDGKFPSKLGCVAVEIDGKRSPITYVQNDQINVQVPTMTSTGNVMVRVITNPDASNAANSDSATLQIQREAPGLFTFDGKSLAARFAGASNIVANPSVVPGGSPAKPGDMVSLFGTGFGFSDPVYQAGEIVAGQARITAPLTVTIGGTTVPASDIQYAGLSPQSISGLCQINVKIPASAADGDLPVMVQVNGQKTQDGTTIPVKR